MDISARLRLKGDSEESLLFMYRDGGGNICVTRGDGDCLTLPFHGSDLPVIDFGAFDEEPDKVRDVLLEMIERLHDAESQGIEVTAGSDGETDDEPADNYSVRDIYVENKPFSVRQLSLLIDDGDLDLNPDFQRNFVWDRTRQSLLIESMLLGLPLPSIYLSQYDDGRLTVVDGLQRITTIRRFLKNELRLTGLEYLTQCIGKTFEELKSEKVLTDLQIRQFNQIQIGCFVIDYRSPDRLKFDLFRRLNTGGKPLNRPEIRNCLTRSEVQRELKRMWDSDAFRMATDHGVSNSRMQALDLVMRYLFFRRSWLSGNFLMGYRGKIDTYLDDFTGTLNRDGVSEEEISGFYRAMDNARYLFGPNAFRKKSYSTRLKRLPINQLLFVVFSVLLSVRDMNDVMHNYRDGEMTERLYALIENDAELRKALSTGTNARWNIETAFNILSRLLDTPA
ncbi:MAG: DUF262 domain-containing protein [Muribaculaceae bacterium]|nr:DUF262 domain-containing protein [Muribaculaceae bacterium]